MKDFKIVSGGQAGGGRAALDFAVANNIPHGGFCPKGRLAEDGAIAACYQLTETSSCDYLQRTEWNARDSDATVIFTIGASLTGGSKRTAQFAEKHGKSGLHLSEERDRESAAERLAAFLEKNRVSVINIAGSRASKEPSIGDFVERVQAEAFGKIAL